MNNIFKDFTFALRMLVKRPGIMLLVAVSLGLGVGINTTVFSWMESLILNPYPAIKQSDWILALNTVEAEGVGGGGARPVSYPTYLDLRSNNHSFADLAVHTIGRFNLRLRAQEGGDAVWGQLASSNYFDVLQVRAALGRTFLADEEKLESPVAVISDKLWRRAFNADPSVIGRHVWLNGIEMTIIGVTPPRFDGLVVGLAFDVWAPVRMQPLLFPGKNDLNSRGDRWLQCFGRLRSDTSFAQARSEIMILSENLSRSYGETPAIPIEVKRLRDQLAGRLLTPLFSIMLAITGVVLLTACANVANLLLARASSRRHEISVRLALGAGRWRIVRQLLIESLLLSLPGGVIGLLVAYFASDLFLLFVPPVSLPIHFPITVNGRAVGFAFLLTLATAILFGLLPAWRASNPNVLPVLKSSERGVAVGKSRLRSALVVAQVALSLVSLVSAGLFARSLQRAQTMPLGFADPNQILVVSTDLNLAKLDQAKALAAIDELQQRVQHIPGVESASFTSMIPLGFGGHSYSGTLIDGYTPAANEELSIERIVVSSDYFDTTQIPIVSGRGITQQDRAESLRVAVVNEAFVRRYWPGQDAIGRRLNQGAGWATVVGVGKDSVIRDLGESTPPVVYSALTQRYTPNLFLQVRSANQPTKLTEAVRRQFAAVNVDLPFLDPRTLAENQTASRFVQFIAATMLTAFGLLALLLSSVGLYGVLGFVVSQRQRELAIRMALGAEPREIKRVVFRQGLVLLIIGLLIGVTAALAIGRALKSQLLGVSPNDPLSFVAGAMLLFVVAFVACYIPARRATKVDPLVALRYE